MPKSTFSHGLLGQSIKANRLTSEKAHSSNGAKKKTAKGQGQEVQWPGK